MKLSMNSSYFVNKTLPEKMRLDDSVKRAADFGFEVLDCSLSDLRFLYTDNDWQSVIKAAKQTADEHGISFRYSHGPFYYPAEDDVKGWEEFDIWVHNSIDAAAILEAEVMVMHPFSLAAPNYSFSNSLKKACESLRPYKEHCDRVGVTLCVENMVKRAMVHMRRFGEVPEDIIAVAEKLDCGICWDTGHANCSGLDAYDSIMQVAPRLKVVHINDNLGLDDNHIPPMLGNINWDAVVQALKDSNYNGDFNMELGTVRSCNAASVCDAFTHYIIETGKYLIGRVAG